MRAWRSALPSCVLLAGAAGADAPPVFSGEALTQKYAGNYDTDALLNEPAIRSRLEALLGDDLPHLLDNLDVRGAADLISGSLSLSGNAVHGGGMEEAVLCVSTYNGAVSAAVLSESVITVYAEPPAYDALTLCIKDWITQVNSGHVDRFVQPANVQFAPAE